MTFPPRLMRPTHKMCGLAVVISAAAWLQAQTSCPPMTPETEARIKNYVTSRYTVPTSTSLTLLSHEPVGDSCYRRLTYEGSNALGEWSLVLYLSPDSRFLSNDLFDTSLDPVEERKRDDAKLMADLTQGTVPSLGKRSARVTVVEFADFECDYCRLLSNLLHQEVLPGNEDKVRIVFRHLPLAVHRWARLAAEGAACAELQNEQSFWKLHDKIFENQSSITTENIRQKLLLFSEQIPSIDAAAFRTCLDGEMSLGLVLRDMNAAKLYKVTAAPTLFVNGSRIEGVPSAARLREMINTAAATESRMRN